MDQKTADNISDLLKSIAEFPPAEGTEKESLEALGGKALQQVYNRLVDAPDMSKGFAISLLFNIVAQKNSEALSKQAIVFIGLIGGLGYDAAQRAAVGLPEIIAGGTYAKEATDALVGIAAIHPGVIAVFRQQARQAGIEQPEVDDIVTKVNEQIATRQRILWKEKVQSGFARLIP